MTSLLLAETWLNLVPDGTGFAAPTLPGRAGSDTVEGRVETFGSGRQRAVVEEGVAGSWSFTYQQLTLADCALLKSWLYRTVLYRDDRGQKFYGTFFSLSWAEMPEAEYRLLYTAAITLNVVTWDEAV